jgi:hypothetical protein
MGLIQYLQFYIQYIIRGTTLLGKYTIDGYCTYRIQQNYMAGRGGGVREMHLPSS